jgi:hypothetical protein
MRRMRGMILGPALLAAGVGGALAPNLFSAGAATPATTTGTTLTSNETTTHESGESAVREAAENNGTATYGDHGSGSNEDATHESSDSTTREQAEDSGTTTPPSAPTPATSTTTGT